MAYETLGRCLQLDARRVTRHASPVAQITLINLDHRTLLTGVEVIGLGYAPLLGEHLADRANLGWPVC